MASEYTDDAPGRLTALPNGWGAFIPDELPPAVEPAPLLQPLSDAAGALGRFTAGQPASLPPEVATRFLVFQEAVASSRIEHLDVSLIQLYAFRDGHETFITDTHRRDVETVSNYVDAYEYGTGALDSIYSVETLCGLHERLLGGVADDKRPGEVREIQNYIGTLYGEPTYIPPPPAHVSPLLKQTVAYSRDGGNYSDIVDAALAHYQFEAIHPFLDGNCRTGRLWFLLSLHAEGVLGDRLLPVSRHLFFNKTRYTDLLLAVSQTGAWGEWLGFMLNAVTKQAAESRATLSDLAGRYDHVTSTYDKQARSASALSSMLFERPVFDINDYVEHSEFSYTTVNRTVERFTEDGLVREATNTARHRVFIASWLDEFSL